MFKLKVFCVLISFYCLLEFNEGLPVQQQEQNANMDLALIDDIIVKLKQLKMNEGNLMICKDFFKKKCVLWSQIYLNVKCSVHTVFI